MRHPSLRSSMRASLFHSLQTFSRFTFAKGPTHRVCTLFPRGGIPLDPTFAAYVSIPDFSSHLPSSLSSFSFFLSFFFFSPRTKKNIPLFCTCSFFGRRFPILSTRCFPFLEYSRRSCERFNLFSRHGGRRGEKKLGKGF